VYTEVILTWKVFIQFIKGKPKGANPARPIMGNPINMYAYAVNGSFEDKGKHTNIMTSRQTDRLTSQSAVLSGDIPTSH